MYLIEFPQVLLLLLVHNNVYTCNGLPDYAAEKKYHMIITLLLYKIQLGHFNQVHRNTVSSISVSTSTQANVASCIFNGTIEFRLVDRSPALKECCKSATHL